METSPIVPELDVPRNILSRLLSRRVSRPVDPLDFQRGIKRFGQAVIETYPCPAHRLPDPQPLQDSGELGGRIVAATIRMKDSISREIEITGRHLDRRRNTKEFESSKTLIL